MADVIELRDLNRRFPQSRFPRRLPAVTALNGLTLDVPAQQIVGLLGPNGAGKTTLLEILATVLWPSSGSARVMGHDVVRAAARVRECIAYVPAGANDFFPRLTGRQNLAYFLAFANVRAADIAGRARAAADAAGIAAALDRPVRMYSDGMRQRLAIARALGVQARVWLLDEPTRSLDPDARLLLRETIGRESRERGVTMLLATHDFAEAAALCDRIAVLRDGRVSACAAPAELIAAHGSLDAAYRATAEIRA